MKRSRRELSVDMFIGVPMKIIKIRPSSVLPSNLKQRLVLRPTVGERESPKRTILTELIVGWNDLHAFRENSL